MSDLATHTQTATGASASRGTDWPTRFAVVTIMALTTALTIWAGAEARAVERQLDRAAATVLDTPVRQIEHAEQTRAVRIAAAQRHDAHRFANQASLSESSIPRDLMELEYSELRRFRNRAPASALPALDAEIERLRSTLFEDKG